MPRWGLLRDVGGEPQGDLSASGVDHQGRPPGGGRGWDAGIFSLEFISSVLHTSSRALGKVKT